MRRMKSIILRRAAVAVPLTLSIASSAILLSFGVDIHGIDFYLTKDGVRIDECTLGDTIVLKALSPFDQRFDIYVQVFLPGWGAGAPMLDRTTVDFTAGVEVTLASYTIPSNANKGTYTVHVNLYNPGEGTAIEQGDITLNVLAPALPIELFLGIGVAAIAVVGLLVAVRRRAQTRKG
ncbi:MAG: hypothetical protein JTT11_08635 [Candidatus Brockarchaeota archaeon]|nr:hypothetical protein [Candidatus Brockarchaeota archaeon]